MTDTATAPESRNGQTDIDMLTRHGIPLTLGERVFRVRPRVMKKDREWVELVFTRVIRRIGNLFTKDADGDDSFEISAIIAALADSPADMLDMIVAYEDDDQTRQLPPSAWIEDNAFTSQITTAFTTLLEEAYPPFAVSRRLLPADRAAAIIGSLATYVIEKATRDGLSEPSVLPLNTGAIEPPRPSKRRSRTASSRS